MKYTSKTGWCAAALLALWSTACDDSEYDLQTLVPEQYHSVVNMQDGTNERLRIYDTGLDKEYEFTVLRGGSDPSIKIEAAAAPMTQQELTEYGADYVLLPKDYYTLDGAVEIAPNEGSDKIRVSFSAGQITAIRELSAALEASKCYCLALKLESDETTVSDSKNAIVRRLDVMQPELGFTPAGEIDVKLYDASQDVTIGFTVARGETDETLPVRAELVPLSQEELSAVNSDFMAVPADLYTLPDTEIELPAGTQELPVSVLFTSDQVSRLRTKAEAENKSPVLSFKLVSDNSKAIADRSELLYVLDITQPILQLELLSGVWRPEAKYWWWDNTPLAWTDYDTDRCDCWSSEGVTFRLKMPEGINNTWTIRCQPRYAPEYIETRNEQTIFREEVTNGSGTAKSLWWKQETSYSPLPDDNDIVFYDANGNRIDEIIMEPGQNEVTFTYRRRSDNWSYNGAGLYLCPIVATSDLFPVDRQNDPYYVLFYDEITLDDKTLWEPAYAQQGSLANLYDGGCDGGCLWHTPWDNGNYIDETYGQYFQINIKQYQPAHGLTIGIWPRSDNYDSGWGNERCSPRHIKVFITSDNVPEPTGDLNNDRKIYDALDWVEAADLNCDATGGMMWLSPAIDLNGRTANAIRICTLTKGDHEGNIWSCTSENPDGMGQYVAIGEFKIWGN